MTAPGGASHNGSSIRDRLVQAVGDRYVIEEELGRGGMAVVFAATDTRLKRGVAIKALPPELAFRADVRSRFLREAQMAAALSHPNIVPVYAVEEGGGLVYMVMGRVRGESLAQRLHRTGRMPFGDVRRILGEAADALAHAHLHGVIHRDIKPDNILIDEESGRVVVTDFGIARAMEGDVRLTITGVAVGTPTYMSPEQARGDAEVDGRSDLYALGVVGFQMLVGEPPFHAPNTPALLLKHVSEPPPPLSTRRSDVPAALAYAIDRSLAKDRTKRWRDAAAMRAALAVDAPPPPMPQVHAAARLSAASASASASANASAANASAANASAALAAQAALRAASNRPPVPAFPPWRGGDDTARAQWQEAQLEWREKVRAQQQAWDDERTLRREAASEQRRQSRREVADRPVAKRLRSFQWQVVVSGLVVMMLFFINAVNGGPPWFLFPALGMSFGIAARALSLWQDGLRFRDFFRRPARFEELEEGSAPPAVRRGRKQAAIADPDERALALVGADALRGPHGATARRAADDEQAVREIVASLSEADRAQIGSNDVGQTLKALVDRIGSLVKALHRLDVDVRPGQLQQIEGRLIEARALADGSPDRDRHVTLLERQRASISELTERRAVLAGQLDSASLVLQTLRLELLRLRSSGIGNVSGDVHGVTQEARALSHDIERVLDAAAEVRKL